MAVLPDADSIGQINTEPQRKMGVGGWDSSIIGRAANEEGAGLERLGGTMGDIGASIYNQGQQKQKEDEAKANALAHAQATGALYTASTQAQLDAQNATDPAKVKEIQTGFSNLVPKIAATISDQNTRDMWVAQNTPHVAEVGARFSTRATELTNNTALANFSTATNATIGNAAKLDDDAASAKALDAINPQIQALVAAGAIKPTDAVDMRMKAAQQWAYARRDYWEAKATLPNAAPADIAAYARFSGVDPAKYGIGPDGKYLPGFGPGGAFAGTPAGTPGAAPAPTAADGSPLPPSRPQAAPTGDQPGMLKPGNIDLEARPQVKMPDGSVATVRSIGIDVDGKEVIIPTVVDGKVVSNDEAVAHFKKTGENLGTFDTPANATAYAKKLHEAQAAFYAPAPPAAPAASGASITPPSGDPSVAARVAAAKPAGPDCVPLVQAVTGAPVTDLWHRGDNAMATRPPPGTGVATFMDRAGNPSDLYDGGQGHGIRGNNTTHAGIVAGYTADGGMILWEQYAGSNGPHLRTYYPNGTGEQNANNYFTIRTGAPSGPGAYPAMGGMQPSSGAAFPATSLPLSTPAGMAAYKARVAQIESQNGADPNAHGNIYQFQPSTWAALGGGNLGDRGEQERQMDALTAKNRAALARGLGRDPTPAELYLAHQQGSGGALQLIQHPTDRAGDIVGDAAVKGNGGDPNWSAAQFVNFWQAKFNRTSAPALPVGTSLPYSPLGQPIAPLLSSPLSPVAVPPPDAVHPAAPPASKLPPGATVSTGPDGSAIMTMADGSTQPVPGSRATGAQWTALPPPPPGSVASMLPPTQRAEMQLRAIGVLDRVQRENAAATKRDDRTDLANVNSLIKDMERGTRLSGPGADDGWSKATAAFASHENPEVRQQYAVAEAVRNRLGALTNASPETVAAAVAKDRADLDNLIATDPTNKGLDIARGVVASEERYATNFSLEAKKDPIGRAAREGFIPPPKAIDPASPTLTQDIADRVQQAKVAAQAMGLPEAQFIRPDERVTMRKIDKAGGDAMVNLAKAVVGGAGPDALSVFKQIGGDAPSFMTIGELALDPNHDQSLTIRRYADYVAAMNDKSPGGAAKDLPRFTPGSEIKGGIDDPIEGALANFSPDDRGRYSATAHILMGEQASTEHKVPSDYAAGWTSSANKDFYKKNWTEAFGGHIDRDGVQWGGPVAASSASDYYKVLLPTNMNAGMFDQVVGSLQPEDIAKMPSTPKVDGKPVGVSQIQRGQFSAVKDDNGLFTGKYMVLLPSQTGQMTPVITDGGKPWIFDMKQVEDRMRRVLPGSFMEKTTAPPPHDRYRDVRPMIADEGPTAAGDGAEGSN